MRRIPSVRDLNNVWVGIVSIAVIGAVVAGAFAIGTLGVFENRYSMSGVFAETGGLRPGVDVRLAGVAVGEVTAVKPDFDRGQVVVTWEVDHGVHLGRNMRAEIAIATLLGGHYLRLSGPIEQPYLEDLPREQRRIPLSRTKVPFSIIGALGDTTRTIQQLDTEAINKVVASVAGTVERNKADIPTLISGLAEVATAIGEREADFRQLVTNSQQITETLAVRDQQLVQLVDAASSLLDQLAARRDELATIFGKGSQVVAALADVIDTHRGALDSVLADLHTTLDAVDRNLGTINTSLAWAGPTLAGLGRVGHHGYFDVVGTGLYLTEPVLNTVSAFLCTLNPGGCS